MKKIILIAFVLVCTQLSFAAFPVPALPAADNTTATLALSKNFKDLTSEQKRQFMEQISKMSVSDYEKMTGKTFNGIEKLGFKLTQQRMKRQLKKSDDSSLFSNFNIGGFLLGFLLSLIGVLIAYLFSSDDDLRKWSWIGAGIGLVFSLLIFAI